MGGELGYWIAVYGGVVAFLIWVPLCIWARRRSIYIVVGAIGLSVGLFEATYGLMRDVTFADAWRGFFIGFFVVMLVAFPLLLAAFGIMWLSTMKSRRGRP